MAIIRAMTQFQLSFRDSNRIEDCKKFMAFISQRDDMITPELSLIMKNLWLDENIQ